MNKKTFYITTPIYYVNSVPHIGHAYTTIAADTIARYKQINGYDVFFATGTDEHGQKIYKASEEKGISPQAFVDDIVIKFKELWQELNLSYTDFIRTTDDRHKQAVIKILEILYEKGDIYKGEYEGWYCVPCETFFPESQLIDNKCPDCNREVDKLSETSYFFRISKYKEWLLNYIKENNLVNPKSRQNEILGFLKNEISDLCISRPKNRLEWGIPLPFDKEHVTYVWFDALINYISVLGYGIEEEKIKKYWPCDVHLIGKDILRPHAVFWIVMLHALGLEIPKKIFAHGWWTISGEKISKSKGNVIDPHSLIKEFGLDAFRYFLLREVPFGADGHFSEEKMVTRINNELANDLGNLVSRSAGMLFKYCEGVVPEFNNNLADDIDKELEVLAKDTFCKIEQCIDKLALSEALDLIWVYIRRINRYIEEKAPWSLNKEEEKRQELENVMFNIINSINIISVLIYPFMPNCAFAIRKQLNIDMEFNRDIEETIEDFLNKIKIKAGLKIEKGEVLFPKKE